MVKQVLQILFVLSFILVFERCAQVGVLSGGKRDQTPPKLAEASPANHTSNFKSKTIELKFDEFVQLKDLTNQLIINPKLKTPPEITTEGKKVLIRLDEKELMPNTTYRFYFGGAIADMNESNSLSSFEYVFSTGNTLDTLKLKGSVKDAFNNKSVANTVIGLYDAASANDSCVYKQEPQYYTRSNENGEFLFKYLPSKTFKAFAFADKNKNNLYDGETEKVAFLNAPLVLSSDSLASFKLFQEEAAKTFIKKATSPYFGFAQIILNKKSNIKLSALNANETSKLYETNVGGLKDTLAIHYRDITDTLKLIVQNLSSKKTDTVKVTVPRNNPGKKRLKAYTLNFSGNKLPLHTPIIYTFLNWMDTGRTDLTKIHFSSKEDSLVANIPIKGHWRSVTSFVVDNKLKEGITYTLKTDTSAFFDLSNFTNDSNRVNFIPQNKSDFGKLNLKLLFNQKQNYVVQLINEQDQVIKEQHVALSLSSSNAVTLEFNDVPPGVYFAKIVFDDNKNKKWDSGALILKQQPEKVIIASKQLKVLSDWEIEEELQIKD